MIERVRTAMNADELASGPAVHLDPMVLARPGAKHPPEFTQKQHSNPLRFPIPHSSH